MVVLFTLKFAKNKDSFTFGKYHALFHFLRKHLGDKALTFRSVITLPFLSRRTHGHLHSYIVALKQKESYGSLRKNV